MTAAIDRLKTGNARPPGLSPQIVDLIREAWVIASVDFGAPQVRSGHLLCALLTDEMLARVAHEASGELQKISIDALYRDLASVVAYTDETGQAAVAEATAGTAAPAPGRPLGPTKTPALDQFTIDLTARARAGPDRSGAGPRSRKSAR